MLPSLSRVAAAVHQLVEYSRRPAFAKDLVLPVMPDVLPLGGTLVRKGSSEDMLWTAYKQDSAGEAMTVLLFDDHLLMRSLMS